MTTKYTNFLENKKFSIFLFHGVIDKPTRGILNYTRKHLPHKYFKNVVLDLLKTGVPITMDQILENSYKKEPLPKKAFSITFDDGFANNLYVAAEILDSLNVPATFYITTNFVQSNIMSWIDRIEFAVEETSQEVINLGQIGSFDLKTNKKKIIFLNKIRNVVKQRSEIDQDLIADKIQRILLNKLINKNKDQIFDKLTISQIQSLGKNNLFTIGGHTHTHPILSFLKEDEMNFEIKKCLDVLKQNCGILTHHFSYPEGLQHCFNYKVITTLKKYGIKICPTAIHGLNEIETDLFLLNRISVT